MARVTQWQGPGVLDLKKEQWLDILQDETIIDSKMLEIIDFVYKQPNCAQPPVISQKFKDPLQSGYGLEQALFQKAVLKIMERTSWKFSRYGVSILECRL